MSGAWARPGEQPAAHPPAAVPVTLPVPQPAASAGSPGFPLRPMSVGELLDSTFVTIRHNTRTMLGLGAVFATAQQLLFAALQLLAGQLSAPALTFQADANTEVGLSLINAVNYPLGAVVGALLAGPLAVVIMADIDGRRTSIRQAWQAVRPRLGALLLAAVVAGVLPYLGLAAVIAPGVMLWGYWAVVTPALVIEGLGPLAALRRSWQLVQGDYWRVFGVRALSVLIGLLMELILVLPFGVVASVLAQLSDADLAHPGLVFLALSVVGNIAAGTVVGPFRAGVVCLLYVDRRMRAEALDIVWQRQAATRGRA